MFFFRVPTRVVKIVFHRGRIKCIVTLLVLGSRFFCGNPPVFEPLIATTLVFLFSRLITTYLPYQFRLLVNGQAFDRCRSICIVTFRVLGRCSST